VNVITRSCETAFDVKHSRFLAELFPVSAQDEARVLLKAQKEKHADASHVVHAFVIGRAGEILGCSDDGEPSGTAGRPVLEALKGSSVTNVLLTVTRWFGGSLLGTGGLVRAYSDAAKAVLALAPVEELVDTRDFSVNISYGVYDRFRRECDARMVELIGETFGTDIEITGRIRENLAADFCAWITDLTSGQSNAALRGENPTERRT